MVFGDYQKYHREISAFSIQLYQEIKGRNYVISLYKLANKPALADKTPADLLRIYGQINIHRIDSILNKKIEDEYKRVDNEFNRIYKENFSFIVSLSHIYEFDPTKPSSRYEPLSAEQAMGHFSLMKLYLSYQPFPVEQAKCLRLYKIKVKRKKIKREKDLTPYEFAKGLRKSYFERIEGIYSIFGGTLSERKLKLKGMLHGELAEIKCRPFPSQNDSWKDTVVAWSKDQNWGAHIPGVEESVSKFLDTYIFSPFLDLSKQRSSEKERFSVIKQKKFVIKGAQFLKEFSFRAYVIEKTIQEFFEHLFGNPDPQDLVEIKVVFSEIMKNEKRRNTFIYFFTRTAESYINLGGNIAQFDYAPYQETLKAQFEALTYLIFKYNEKAEEKYILSQKKEEFYDLLFSYLLAIHVFKVCPAVSQNDRRGIFKGIWRMESSERLALYDFLCCQVREPIGGRQQSTPSILYKIVTNVFSKLPFLRRYSISTIPPSSLPISGDFNKINEFLKNYSFSETEEIRIKIQSLFFHSGLMTKITEVNDQGFQPIDFAFCVELILNIQEICGFQLPSNVVCYLLTWNYVDKKGIKKIEHFKDRLEKAKAQARTLILKEESFFFISPQNRQYIDKVISSATLASTFISKNEAEEAFYDCLQYTIYPHIAPRYFYPFIFLAFELRDARFNRLKDWGEVHCGMFRKLEPYQSALRVDAYWKKIGNEEYFQIHLTYFPSSHIPQSFYMEETLQISRERLRRDWSLCQILRIFSIFLADEFEPIKTGDLKSGDQRQSKEKEGKKIKLDVTEPESELPESPKLTQLPRFTQFKTGDLKSGDQRQSKKKEGKKIKLDVTEPESELPESPKLTQLPRLIQFPKYTRYKSGHFEEVLSCFDNPIFSYLWKLYEAEDKDELCMLIYEFFFRIKRGVRKKMDGIFFPKKIHVEAMKDEDILKNVLEGTIYSDDHHVSLIPLNLLNRFPHYSVKKEDYSRQMEDVLDNVQLNLEFTWKSFFKIKVQIEEELIVDVIYEFTTITHCDYHQQQAVELKSILKQKALIEGGFARPDLAGILSRLETSEESDENLIETKKHKIIFSCLEGKISFSMAYDGMPSLETLYWQIAMLKREYVKALHKND